MERKYSLKKNSEFGRVYRRGKSGATPLVVVIYLRGGELKIGFSVSKKLGNAVVRNKIKRRLREVLRPKLPGMRKGKYIIIAREGILGAKFSEIERSLEGTLIKMGLKQQGSNRNA